MPSLRFSLRLPFRRLLPIVLLLLLGLAGRASTRTDSPVVVTEIQYHPAGASDSEWLELHCLSGVNVDLSGWSLQGGISYTFPEGTTISGRGYLVVAANPGAANLVGVSALGPYSGALSNSGDEIIVVNRNGRVMDDVNYLDSGDWPVGADGSGVTLSKRNFDSGDENSTNWTWSGDVGGTPGADNFGNAGTLPVTTLLTDLGATWKYFDAGTAAPAGWNAPGFNDSAWSSGPGVLYAGSAQTTGGGANLLGYWPLHEGAGTVANNQVSGGVNGTLVNGPTWVTDPVHGKVLQFNGTSNYVSVGTATIPQMTTANNFTWAFWANSGETGTTNSIVGNRHSPSGADWSPPEFIKFTTAMFEFYHNGQDGASYGTAMPVNVWAHHSIVKNGTLLSYYRNGSLLNTHTITGGLNHPQPLYFGGDQEYWKGLLCDVAIWTRALAASEVSALAAGTQTPATVGAAGVLATQLPLGPTTYYFRSTFNYSGSPARTTLDLRSLVDDGAVVYLNGVEIYRVNMPTGTPAYDTLASTTVGNAALSGLVSVPASALVRGTNVLAAEVHQDTPGSQDMVFGLQLTATQQAGSQPDVAPSMVINEISPGGAGFQVELANVGAAPVNLAGLSLVSSAGPGYALPPGVLNAGGFLVLDAATLGYTPVSGDKLFLYAGNGGSLLDAQKVSKKLRGRAPDGQWLFPSVATFGSANAFAFNTSIVINEIMYQPPALSQTPYVPSTEQWIELYNRSAASVNLGSWSFGSGITYTFPTNTILPAGGYLVVSNNAAALQAKWPAVASKIIGNFTGSISGKGEKIELDDAFGNPVNAVTFAEGGNWPAAANGGGSSLELRDPRSDNSQPGAWAASNESARGSWQNYTFSGLATNFNGDPTQWNEFDFGLLDAGTYLISDISVIESPGSTNRQLISNGSFTNGTATWRFLGTQSHATVIPDPSNPGAKVLQVVSTGGTEHMHNHVETTLQSGGAPITINSALTYQISFRARWVSGSNELNTRLYFNRLAQSVLLPVAPGGGTPGMPNSTAVANAGPTSSGLIHAPAVPAASQSATVTISGVSDPDGVASVTLFYAVNGGSFVSAPMTNQGNGTYTAVIPGQAAATKVQFYVQALDTLGAASFFPAAGPNSRAMIPWDDGQELLTVNGVQPTNLRIVLPPADITALYTATNVMSNDPVPCTVIADESNIFYNAGVHLHGSERGRDQNSRVSFHLDFPADNLFLGVHSSVIMDRSGGGDVTSQSEIMIKHAITHASGVPGSEDDLCHIIAPQTVNNGPAILIKEDFNSAYLNNQYTNGAGGMQFKYEYIYYPLTTASGDVQGFKLPEPDSVVGVAMNNLGLSKELYRWHWLVQNNVDKDDFSGLITWLTAFGGTANAQYFSSTASLMDVDEWMRCFAIEMLFGIGDNYGGGNVGHNAIVYQRPSDARWVFLPHDMDFTFSSGTTSSLAANPDQVKLMGNPGNARAFYGHVQDICNTTFNTAYMQPWAVHYSKFLNEDLTTHLSYISQREAYALGQVSGAIPAATFAITTPNGTSFSGNVAVITGTGPVNLRQLILAGGSAPLAVTWTTTTAWQVSLPINTGPNNITINAYDFEGAAVGSPQSVSVIGTGTLVPASAANLTVSKVMYHPADPTSAELTAGYSTGDDFEYLEVMNISSSPVSLTGVQFTTGITYSFASGLQLAAGARLVVPYSNAAFVFRYGSGVPLAAGGYGPGSKLSNSGEQIALVDASGVDIKRFTYSDLEPWPTGADGSGAALVLIKPLSNPDVTQPANWRLSVTLGGSPGASDATQFTGNPTADDDHNGIPNFLQYALAGTAPYVAPAVSTVAGQTVIQFTRNLAADDAVLTVETSTDLVGWGPLPAGYSMNSELPAGNGDSTVVIAGPALDVPARFFRVKAVQAP